MSLVVATDAMVAANVLTGFMDTMPPTSVRVVALPTGSLKLEFPARGGLPTIKAFTRCVTSRGAAYEYVNTPLTVNSPLTGVMVYVGDTPPPPYPSR